MCVLRLPSSHGFKGFHFQVVEEFANMLTKTLKFVRNRDIVGIRCRVDDKNWIFARQFDEVYS